MDEADNKSNAELNDLKNTEGMKESQKTISYNYTKIQEGNEY